MRVFVAAPYTAESFEQIKHNVRDAIAAGVVLIQRGHEPFVPHLSHFLDMTATGNGACIPYERWMVFTLAWLGQCQALLYLAPSPGADRERARALELGLTVYERIEDVPEVEEVVSDEWLVASHKPLATSHFPRIWCTCDECGFYRSDGQAMRRERDGRTTAARLLWNILCRLGHEENLRDIATSYPWLLESPVQLTAEQIKEFFGDEE